VCRVPKIAQAVKDALEDGAEQYWGQLDAAKGAN
jgi:hypothetical protein